jgi:hypothetical protein
VNDPDFHNLALDQVTQNKPTYKRIDPDAKGVTIRHRRMSHRVKAIAIVVLVLAAIGFALLGLSAGGPVYQGRRTAVWVRLALLADSRSGAYETVLNIGPAAVPYVARQGLHDKSHTFHFLSGEDLLAFRTGHPRLCRWPLVDRLLRRDYCVARHEMSIRLLWRMGTNAQAAVPDVIDCLEHCPSLRFHHAEARGLLETLSRIAGTSPIAVAYLTKLARGDLNLRAAVYAYYLTGQTNLLVETCQRLAQANPSGWLSGQTLFWFTEDPIMNQQVVAMLKGLSANPRLCDRDRKSALLKLESLRNATTNAALARLRGLATNAPVNAR